MNYEDEARKMQKEADRLRVGIMIVTLLNFLIAIIAILLKRSC